MSNILVSINSNYYVVCDRLTLSFNKTNTTFIIMYAVYKTIRLCLSKKIRIKTNFNVSWFTGYYRPTVKSTLLLVHALSRCCPNGLGLMLQCLEIFSQVDVYSSLIGC